MFLPCNVQYPLYVDDLQFYLHVHYCSISDGNAALRRVLQAMFTWAMNSTLKINVSKTQTAPFRCRKATFMQESLSWVRVPAFIESDRDLDVILDSQLVWKPHMDYITKKKLTEYFTLYAFFENIPRRLCENGFGRKHEHLFIFPHLGYCSTIVSRGSLTIRTKLQTLQNTFVRYVCGIRRDEHVTAISGWLRTNSRR